MLMWPLVGVDPMPGRIGYPFRLLVMFLMLPFHAFLGISIMSANRLIAEDWYLAFERAWPPSPLEDQYLAGAIMWASGDVTALLMLGPCSSSGSRTASARPGGRIDGWTASEAALIARGTTPLEPPEKITSVTIAPRRRRPPASEGRQ